MRIANTVSDSIVDGPGLRFTVFTQGCPHRCPGCHNPGTHDPAGGREVSVAELGSELAAELSGNPLTDGLTLSGGEPFCQAAECAALLGAARVVGVEPDPWRRRLALEQGLVALALDPADPELESAVAAATEGRGADGVIECAGGRDTFQAAWRLARPNGTVALVAMYEENQTLPLPAMYGKNLVFKTGGVDASRGPELVSLLAQGKLRTDFLITHRGPLSEILEGYRVFGAHEEHCLKWVVTPG